MIADIIRDAETKMANAVEYAKEEFAAIRTGRAHPAMFVKLTADYYGSPTPLQQLATFQVPDARVILITPYDRSAMTSIERRFATPTSASTRPTTATPSGSPCRS